MNDDNNKWHVRFLKMAEEVASWSKDPSTKVGAVIVDRNRRVVSTGYNGIPRGVEDTFERLNDRNIKYKIILHAEENAMMYAKQPLGECSLYVTSLPPCSHCASLIIQSGIKNVYVNTTKIPDRWTESCKLTMEMFNEAGVELHFIDMGA